MMLLCITGLEAANVLRATSISSHGAPAGPSWTVTRRATPVEEPSSDRETLEKQGVFSALAEEVEKVQHDPKVQENEKQGGSGVFQRVVLQLIYGVIYYFIIVKKYLTLKELPASREGPLLKSKEVQQMNALKATFSSKMKGPICLCAWLCTGPRAAHTFHATGVMNYWLGLFLMTCFPCCTLCATNAFTNLNEKLEGERQSPIAACILAMFCSCCLVAQDAQSLDYLTGQDTEVCGVVNGRDERDPYNPYGK